MVTLTPAESDAISDGAIVFFGSLAVGAVGTAFDPHAALYSLPVAAVAGIIAGLNRWRQDTGLPSATAGS